MNDELQQLVQASKGKFFSLTFIKKDGTTRVVNGKNKYDRLIAGGDSTLKAHGYVSLIDRNKNHGNGGWVAAHSENAVKFKCGSLERTFQL